VNLPRFVALITAVALLAAPLAAHAQQTGKVCRVGVFGWLFE